MKSKFVATATNNGTHTSVLTLDQFSTAVLTMNGRGPLVWKRSETSGGGLNARENVRIFSSIRDATALLFGEG